MTQGSAYAYCLCFVHNWQGSPLLGSHDVRKRCEYKRKVSENIQGRLRPQTRLLLSHYQGLRLGASNRLIPSIAVTVASFLVVDWIIYWMGVMMIKCCGLIPVVPEHEPKILGGRGHYRPGDRVRVNCTSGPSKPAASLAWYINDKKVRPRLSRSRSFDCAVVI